MGKVPVPSSPMRPLLLQVPAPQPWIRCLETKDLAPDLPGDFGHFTCYYRACFLTCNMGSGQKKSFPMGLVCNSVSPQSDRQTSRHLYTHTLIPTDSHSASHTPLHTRTCTRFHTFICACTWPLACFGCSSCHISYFSLSDSPPSYPPPFLFSFLSHLLPFTSPLISSS